MGHKENMIDRFDVRAHLDYIPVTHKNKQNEEEEEVEGQINYEAFRVLAQNEFLGSY